MIIHWQTLANRQKRRAVQEVARRKGIELQIMRVCSTAVHAHIRALSGYFVNPTLALGEALEQIEGEPHPQSHLPRYLLNPKLHSEKEQPSGERVLYQTTRNLLTRDLEDQQFEFALVAGMAPGPVDPIEHVIASWVEGEEPSPEQIEELVDILLEVAGMRRHQLFAVLHGDTDNRHLHLMINRVDPLTGRRHEFGGEHTRGIDALHQAISIVEHRQGWLSQDDGVYRTDHGGTVDRKTGVKVLDDKLQPCANASDWRAIRDARRAESVERKIPQEAHRFELRTGLHSLQRRVIDDAAPVLRAATNWEVVHRELAALGMRYRILPEGKGALIECGDRALPASTAWGGASASKMLGRLDSFEKPPEDVVVAPWDDCIFPHRAAALERDRQRRHVKEAQALSAATAAETEQVIGVGYHDGVAALGPADRGAALNASRKRIADETKPARQAVVALERRYRQRCKKWRARLRARALTEDFLCEHDEAQASAIIVGSRGQATELVEHASEGFSVRRIGDEMRYFLGADLAFTEHRDRIDLHLVRDDEALRAALLLGARKWGSVVVTGDQETLHRLARIAVAEGVDIVNPALQPMMTALRVQMAAEREKVNEDVSAIQMEHELAEQQRHEQQAQDVAILRDYSPIFREWYRHRNLGNISNGARALEIVEDPHLKRELEELESQRLAVAFAIRSAADWERRQRDRASASASDANLDQHQDRRDMDGGGIGADGLATPSSPIGTTAPEQGESHRQKQQRAVHANPGSARGSNRSGAPSPSDRSRLLIAAARIRERLLVEQTASGWPDDEHHRGWLLDPRRSHVEMPRLGEKLSELHASDAVFTLTPEQLQLQKITNLRAAHRRDEIELDLQRALEQRAGGREGITPFAAALLLRLAARRRRDAHAPNARREPLHAMDDAEAEVLRRNPAFAALYDRVLQGDPRLLSALKTIVDHNGSYDALGLVTIERGRVNFKHRHDPRAVGGRGSAPGLLVRQALAKLGKRMPLLHRDTDGTVGLYDEELLTGIQHNYVGLLQPEIQAQLEVVWRVQQERRIRILQQVGGGSLRAAANVRRDRHSSRTQSVVRLVDAESAVVRLPLGLRDDPDFYFDVIRAKAGVGRAERPLAQDPVVSAWLRARDDKASPTVMMLLADTILEGGAQTTVTLCALPRREALAIVDASSSDQQGGQIPKPTWQPRRRRRGLWPRSNNYIREILIFPSAVLP